MVYELPQLPFREKNSNKGSFGKILNIAGSRYMPGAAHISSLAATTSGAGLVCLLSEESVIDAVSAQNPMITYAPLIQLMERLSQSDVLLIGCGLSTSESAQELFECAILNSNIPTVVDADGINILAQKSIPLPPESILPPQSVLTPHPLEAARLLNVDLETVLNNFAYSAKDIARTFECVVVLKAHTTIVTDGKEFFENTTETTALAKGGSGDVLAGMIAAFLAQNMTPFDAAALAVHLHGKAGDLAAKNLTEHCVTALDTIRFIPNAFMDYAR